MRRNNCWLAVLAVSTVLPILRHSSAREPFPAVYEHPEHRANRSKAAYPANQPAHRAGTNDDGTVSIFRDGTPNTAADPVPRPPRNNRPESSKNGKPTDSVAIPWRRSNRHANPVDAIYAEAKNNRRRPPAEEAKLVNGDAVGGSEDDAASVDGSNIANGSSVEQDGFNGSPAEEGKLSGVSGEKYKINSGASGRKFGSSGEESIDAASVGNSRFRGRLSIGEAKLGRVVEESVLNASSVEDSKFEDGIFTEEAKLDGLSTEESFNGSSVEDSKLEDRIFTEEAKLDGLSAEESTFNGSSVEDSKFEDRLSIEEAKLDGASAAEKFDGSSVDSSKFKDGVSTEESEVKKLVTNRSKLNGLSAEEYKLRGLSQEKPTAKVAISKERYKGESPFKHAYEKLRGDLRPSIEASGSNNSRSLEDSRRQMPAGKQVSGEQRLSSWISRGAMKISPGRSDDVTRGDSGIAGATVRSSKRGTGRGRERRSSQKNLAYRGHRYFSHVDGSLRDDDSVTRYLGEAGTRASSEDRAIESGKFDVADRERKNTVFPEISRSPHIGERYAGLNKIDDVHGEQEVDEYQLTAGASAKRNIGSSDEPRRENGFYSIDRDTFGKIDGARESAALPIVETFRVGERSVSKLGDYGEQTTRRLIQEVDGESSEKPTSKINGEQRRLFPNFLRSRLSQQDKTLYNLINGKRRHRRHIKITDERYPLTSSPPSARETRVNFAGSGSQFHSAAAERVSRGVGNGDPGHSGSWQVRCRVPASCESTGTATDAARVRDVSSKRRLKAKNEDLVDNKSPRSTDRTPSAIGNARSMSNGPEEAPSILRNGKLDGTSDTFDSDALGGGRELLDDEGSASSNKSDDSYAGFNTSEDSKVNAEFGGQKAVKDVELKVMAGDAAVKDQSGSVGANEGLRVAEAVGGAGNLGCAEGDSGIDCEDKNVKLSGLNDEDKGNREASTDRSNYVVNENGGVDDGDGGGREDEEWRCLRGDCASGAVENLKVGGGDDRRIIGRSSYSSSYDMNGDLEANGLARSGEKFGQLVEHYQDDFMGSNDTSNERRELERDGDVSNDKSNYSMNYNREKNESRHSAGVHREDYENYNLILNGESNDDKRSVSNNVSNYSISSNIEHYTGNNATIDVPLSDQAITDQSNLTMLNKESTSAINHSEKETSAGKNEEHENIHKKGFIGSNIANNRKLSEQSDRTDNRSGPNEESPYFPSDNTNKDPEDKGPAQMSEEQSRLDKDDSRDSSAASSIKGSTDETSQQILQ
nr:dentin sialophosphoprotein-like [Nomia melanderi]